MGLDPATTVRYRVSAINSVGAGDHSNEASAMTDATVPDAPTDLGAVERMERRRSIWSGVRLTTTAATTSPAT